MTQELLDALQTWWNQTGNADLRAAFPGGYWRDEHAESNAAMPYLVSNVIAAPRFSGYGWDKTQPVIQFSAYGIQHDQTGSALNLFVARLSAGPLTLSSGAMFDSRCTIDPMPSLDGKDTQGNDVWRWLCEFAFGISAV
jgi:hypothetical protein